MRKSHYAVRILGIAALAGLTACGGASDEAAADAEAAPAPPSLAVELWKAGTPAFGVFVPNERPREEMRAEDGTFRPPLYTAEGGAALAANPLVDYLFLNLEGQYDPSAIEAMAAGLARHPEANKTLLVRIPPISEDGEEAARTRILEAFAAGAHGVVVPHVRSVEEARLAAGYFAEAGVDIWSPGNPTGTHVGMLMIEDPGALAQAAEIADVPGYSVLACGIGSLTRALEGDREAAEAGNLEVLAQATRVGMPDIIPATENDVAERIDQGFLGLLMMGRDAETTDAGIMAGRSASGR